MSSTATGATSSSLSASFYTSLTEILRDVFEDDALIAAPEMTAAHVDGWDSMGNVRLFLAIEQEFRVRFNASEISGIKNLGELVALIEQKSAR